MPQIEQLQQHLHTLRMPTAVEVIGDLLTTATRETWSIEKFLAELLEQELEGRRQRRTERLQKSSHLPAGKTWPISNRNISLCVCAASWLNSAPVILSIALKIYSSLVCLAVEIMVSFYLWKETIKHNLDLS